LKITILARNAAKTKFKEMQLMRQNKTRQRQGRDFFNHLAAAEMSVESNYNNIDGIIGNSDPKDEAEKNRDFLNRIERFKEDAERNAEPTDGHEPAPERSL
jgi:hypothetical protein